MVYDEGIEFGMGEKNTSNYSNFLIFMNYSLNDGKTLPEVKTKFYSHCYQTIIGWFYAQENKWGCIWGHKKIENWKKPTNGEAPEKQIVLEKSITSESFLEKEKKTNNNFNFDFNTNNNKDNVSNNENYYFSDSYSYETNFLQLKSKTNSKNKNRNKNKNKNNNKISNKSMSLLKLNNSFNNHAEIVRRINLMDLGWTAKTYDNIHDRTLGEMNNIYGKNEPSASTFKNINDDEKFRFKSKAATFNSDNNSNFYENFYFSKEGKNNNII
jgi:hypothetical protein